MEDEENVLIMSGSNKGTSIIDQKSSRSELFTSFFLFLLLHVYSGTFAELLLRMNVYLRLPGCILFNRGCYLGAFCLSDNHGCCCCFLKEECLASSQQH
jgi:hypothetical protein